MNVRQDLIQFAGCILLVLLHGDIAGALASAFINIFPEHLRAMAICL